MPATHIVQPGECLSSIAAKYGFASWRTIYDDPANADFKSRRPNPNLIYAGDALVIPEKKKKSSAQPTGKKHKFKVNGEKTLLRLKPDVSETYHYVLEVGFRTYRGKTDGKTVLEHEIRPDAQDATLTLWPASAGDEAPDDAIRYSLAIGHQAPLEEVAGVQGALTALGYYWGAIDGSEGPETREALKAFQRDAGDDPTGIIDDAVRDKIRQKHGC